MKKKLMFILICIILSLGLCQTSALAAGGSVGLSVNPDTIAVGDLFDITVSFSGKEDAIGSLQARLEYDASMMQYMSGGGSVVEISGGTGGVSAVGGSDIYNDTYVLRFTALKSGKAVFNVKNVEIVGYNSGHDMGGDDRSISVNISDAEQEPDTTAQSTAGTSESPALTEEVQEDEPIPVDIDGKTAYLLRDFGEMALPDGFAESMVRYGEEEIRAAYSEQFGISIVCLMDAGGNTAFYIYQDEGKTLFPYVRIDDNNIYVLSEPERDPEGLAKTFIQYRNSSIAVWDAKNGSLPLVYALNGNGEGDFYYFNAEDGSLLKASPDGAAAERETTLQETNSTISAATQETTASSPKVAEEQAYSPWGDRQTMTVVYGLACLALILLIAVIVAKKKKNKHC